MTLSGRIAVWGIVFIAVYWLLTSPAQAGGDLPGRDRGRPSITTITNTISLDPSSESSSASLGEITSAGDVDISRSRKVEIETSGRSYQGHAPGMAFYGCQSGLSVGSTYGAGAIGGESKLCQKLRAAVALHQAGYKAEAHELFMQAHALVDDNANVMQAGSTAIYAWVIKPLFGWVPLLNKLVD